jgi:hypothetical protein
MRKTVILEDNRMLNLRKDPVKPTDDPVFRAKIVIRKVCENFTTPVNSRNYFPTE